MVGIPLGGCIGGEGRDVPRGMHRRHGPGNRASSPPAIAAGAKAINLFDLTPYGLPTAVW